MVLGVLGAGLAAPVATAAPAVAEVRDALVTAVAAMHRTCSREGGYVWACGPDGGNRIGEGVADKHAAWVQPPGTPTVGDAFLDAWEATRDPRCLEAARDAGRALVRGQLHSGGWYYRIEFDPGERRAFRYRSDGGAPPRPTGPSGWETWRQRRNRGNQSMLDDDTTQSALRFLMRLESLPEVVDPALRSSVDHGIEALLGTQYPVGAWSHNFDAFPASPPGEADYPVLRARYPDDWPRRWPNAWNGCYHLNDRISLDCIRTLLSAHDLYGNEAALQGALRGGEFLLRAQMPDPQPAWCQQYDATMQPVWERKFEPPAISGGESQDVIALLPELFRRTGDARFLEAADKALGYLRKREAADRTLARYYELRTDKPLYFDREYRLGYDKRDVPDHYAFTVASRLDRLESELRRCRAGKAPRSPAPPTDPQVEAILAAAGASGLWLEPGTVRSADGRKVRPPEGIVSSATFARNVSALSAWLRARK